MTAKFSSADRVILAWKVLSEIEYLAKHEHAVNLLNRFVNLGNVHDIAAEILGMCSVYVVVVN